MDGLRHVELKVKHDCPMARLSVAHPQAEFWCWTGHGVEVVDVRVDAKRWPAVATEAKRALGASRILPGPTGGLVVWHPKSTRGQSISRILEDHDCIWLQPMRVHAGWEHYDAIAYGRGEQNALDALSAKWTTQVTRRRDVGPDDLAASLFMSMGPVLDAPTPKQAEALVAAAEAGYYQAPRGATTQDVAEGLGLGRSAFEERLRGAENRILGAVAPALAHRRLGRT